MMNNTKKLFKMRGMRPTQMQLVFWKSLMSWATLWKLGATPQLNTGLLQKEGVNPR